MRIREYENYEKYIEHQKEKSLDPKRIKVWLRRMEGRTNAFHNRISHLKEIVNSGKVLCTGARMGNEILAFKKLGYDCIGIDLVERKEFNVIYGNFEDLQFENENFDIYYSNSIDHSLNPDKFISEAYRVLKSSGIMVLDIDIDMVSEYEVFEIYKKEDVIGVAENGGFKLLADKTNLPKMYRKADEHQLIFKKRG